MSNATTVNAKQRFKNVYERTQTEDPTYYHEADLLNNLWSPPAFLNAPTTKFCKIQYVLSDKMALFMRKAHANRIECTQAVNVYIKENNLQSTDNRRKIIPDALLSDLLGPFAEDLTYFNLQSYIGKHIGNKAPIIGPDYAPDHQLQSFITNTALPFLNEDYQEANSEDYVWNPDVFNAEQSAPITEELLTIDAVAPTVVLDYINNKKLRKVKVTVKYDKPLFDMLGLSETDQLTYDKLANLLRAKMYPELATKATKESSP